MRGKKGEFAGFISGDISIIRSINLFQRFHILTKKMIAYRFLMKQHEYNRHMIKIIIDMDDLTGGFPAISFCPKPPISFRGRPYYFQFHVQKNGEQSKMGEIQLG